MVRTALLPGVSRQQASPACCVTRCPGRRTAGQIDEALDCRESRSCRSRVRRTRVSIFTRAGERPMAGGHRLLLDGAIRRPAARGRDGRLGFELRYSSAVTTYSRPHRQVKPTHLRQHVDHPLKIELHTAVARTLPIVRSISPTIRVRSGAPGRQQLTPALVSLLLHVSSTSLATCGRMPCAAGPDLPTSRLVAIA